MYINDTTRQMIREIVVELFQEVLQPNPIDNKQVIQLTDTLDDIIKNKVDNYKVEVYGVSLKEY
jgi:chorismate mutase